MPRLSFVFLRSLTSRTEEFPDGARVVLGRSEGGQWLRRELSDGEWELLIPALSLSERHARVTLQNGGAYVEDLRSRNGTLLRLAPTERRALGGDTLWLGPEVAMSTEGAERSLPGGLDALRPDELLATLREQFSPRGVEVAVGPPEEGSLEFDGPDRHLTLRPSSGACTLDVADQAWARSLVGAWLAARDRRREEVPWYYLPLSPSRAEALSLAKAFAPTNLPVLLLGPQGSGRGVLAQDLHAHSACAEGPFVVVRADDLRGVDLRTQREALAERAAGGSVYWEDVHLLAPAAQEALAEDIQRLRRDPALRRGRGVRVMASANERLMTTLEPQLLSAFPGVLCVDVSAEDPVAAARALLEGPYWVRRPLPVEAVDGLLAEVAARRLFDSSTTVLARLERVRALWHEGVPWAEAWAAAERPQSPPVTPRPAPLPASPRELALLVNEWFFLRCARETPATAALSRRLKMTYQAVDQRYWSLDLDPKRSDFLASLARRERELQGRFRLLFGQDPQVREALRALVAL